MSIEARIDKLIEAIEANTAALLGGGAAPKKGSGGKASGGSKASKPKGPSLDDLTALAGKIMKGETDIDADDGKKVLMAYKKEFGVKVSETPEDKIADGIAYLTAAVEEGGGSEESEEDLM